MAEQGANPVRVLLLARAGEARSRLEAALSEAGAELLGAVDPNEGDPAEAVALRPGAVLVALEAAIEDALERYGALLEDPAVLVMFDEAELAARREGWDAARWVRHLAAKLNGHGDVLPPGAEAEDAVHPVPGPLPEREFDPASLDLGALADAAQDLASGVPRAEGFDAQALPDEAAGDGATGAGPAAAGDADGFSGLVAAEDMDWSSSPEADPGLLADDPELARLLADAAAASRDDGAGADVAPGLDEILSSALDSGEPRGDDGVAEAPAADEAPAPGGTGVPAIDPLSLGDGLSLADDDAPLATRDEGSALDLAALEARLEGMSLVGDDAPLAERPAADGIDIDALASRLDGLSLADPDSYGHGQLRGAVVVEAGLGGPDAVRQLLGGLGKGFPRPVLVRLKLDGGRYERLVQQMQRASVLPVALAEAGASAEAGTVYFLPPEITVVEDRARLRFAWPGEGVATGYDALPAADSAVLFLSGADADRVDRAMALAGQGALVLAQAPESCYDGTAVTALIGRGAVTAEPGDLAQALLDRWP